MKSKAVAFVAGLLMAAGIAYATEVELRPDHPQTYVVQSGDTLWDISAKFLLSPWLWPKLWQANPQIENPHLIYPGDELRLVWVNDPVTGVATPSLVKDRDTTTRIVKLGPKVRVSESKAAIPTVSLRTIQPWLLYEQVISEEDLESRPYVVGSNDKTSRSAAKQTLYARSPTGQIPAASELYGLYRRGDEIRDPETDERLGYKATLVGVANGTPAGGFIRLDLTESKFETRSGDLIMPIMDSEDLPIYFQPRNPDNRVKGYLLHAVNEGRYAGKLDVVAINLGKADKIQPGHVLAILRPGAEIYDNPPEAPTYKEDSSALERMMIDFEGKKSVRLPDERIGELMVFKSYDHVSYALVMRADKPATALDIVTNP